MSNNKLYNVIVHMAKDHIFGSNNVAIEFFIWFWENIGHDYTSMVVEAIKRGVFFNGVTKRLITLIYKISNRKILDNWQPITVLNVV